MSSLRRALKLSLEESSPPFSGCSDIESRRSPNKRSNAFENCKARAKCDGSSSSARGENNDDDTKSREDNGGTKTSEHHEMKNCKPKPKVSAEKHDEDDTESRKNNDGLKTSEHDEIIREPTEDDDDMDSEDELGASIYKSSLTAKSLAGGESSISVTGEAAGTASISTTEKVSSRRTSPRHNFNSSVSPTTRESNNPLRRLRNMQIAQKRPHPPSPSEGATPRTLARSTTRVMISSASSTSRRQAGGNMKMSRKRHHPPAMPGTTPKKSHRSTRSSVTESNNAASVGDVGYTFRKQFEGYDGWYTGKVVSIRPVGGEHGGDRRCVYEDGDSEDLNLTQLQNLALLDPENNALGERTAIEQQARVCRSEQRAKRNIPDTDSLAKAAASGCRKCRNQLDSGKKTCKAHCEDCPRKRGGWYKEQVKKYSYDEIEKKIQESVRAQSRGNNWTLEEDLEFVKRVRQHGEGKWKTILENSFILQERYKTAPSVERARAALKMRWQTLQHMKARNKDGFSDQAHDNESVASFAMDSESESDEEEDTQDNHRLLESVRAQSRGNNWTLEEDLEFVKRVRQHGEGKWKTILENSPILQERYKTAPSVQHARSSLKMRWQKTLKHMKARNKDDISDQTYASVQREAAHDDESEEEIQESGRAQGKGMRWTLEEELEFVKRVRLHGEAKWKEILDNSPILRERYKTAPSAIHARDSLRVRWPITLKHMKAWNNDDFSDQAHDNESVASFADPDSSDESMDSESESDEEEDTQDIGRLFGRGTRWLAEEDEELRKRVRLHGEGNWKDILDNSQILQDRYKTASSAVTARECIYQRWRRKHMKTWNDDDHSDGVQGKSDESMDSESESDDEEEDTQDTERLYGSGTGWLAEEDEELRKRVRLHGEGNWKDILDNSEILQDRYKTASSAKIARQCIFLRWRRKHMENWNDDDHSDGVQDNSDESIESESESGDEEDSQDTHSHSQKKWPSQYSTEENEELRKRVRLHGEGNWKVILDNSPILQERYKSTVSAKSARQSIANIWGKYHKKNCRMHK
eukprot:CAMPEP_0172330226 /NCGR_PEP_ID=MMETSP1058-20130122/61291_1 /TAXON_ID=83371 /ORGANISM="Detonula confervacea, Strain CCMP 353" /LENGTH=1041 /DNA_ID=CAMNT_0013047431 /DNA_START=37 /DNA_END=3162 /DNA_ORIENTATION=-